jgi:hypothetical protein
MERDAPNPEGRREFILKRVMIVEVFPSDNREIAYLLTL